VGVHEFFVTFISSLFVTVDIVGVLPVYLGFVASLDVRTRQRAKVEATITAVGIGVGFLVFGDAVLHLVGVSVGDFQMAGGLLLRLLAIYALLHPELPLPQPAGHLGVVPWARRSLSGLRC
jgi:multiple antibiotic resistance protein